MLLGHRHSFFPHGELHFDSTRHGAIFGATGSGKSTLLTRIAIDHIREGGPLFIVDPHGTLISSVLPYVPLTRLRDVVIFDPLDPDKQIGLNPLQHGDEVAAAALIEILASQFGENSFMGRSRDIATNFLFAAVHVLPDPKPFDLALMFMFEDFAKDIFERCPVEWLRLWGRAHFGKPNKDRQNAEAAPSNKANALVTMTKVRHIFAQANGLDFFQAMQTKKLVFFNLRKGQIGEEAANLIGSVVIRMTLSAALQRDATAKNDHLLVIADEFHNFTKGGNGPDQLLSESRKYALSFILADQTIGELPVASIFANVSLLAVFNVSAKDADQLGPELRMDSPGTLVELKAGEFWAKVKLPDLVLTKQHARLPIWYRSADRKKEKFPLYLQAKNGDECRPADCYRYSRENHGVQRTEVEAQINASLKAATAAKGERHERSAGTSSQPRKAARGGKGKGSSHAPKTA
jgi:energy-coupling factor transporter ATP-binding protein EcfA2